MTETDRLEAIVNERHELYLEKFESAEKLVALALSSSDKAIDKAEHAQELRNIVGNEFREQLRDQAATFITRNEFNDLKEQLDKEQSRGDVNAGKGLGQGAVVAIIVGAVGLVGTIISIIVVLANLFT